MNRQDEYQELLAKLETIPESDPVGNAMQRRRRERRVWKPLASVAAVFFLFVGMVNLSHTVSAACREIPLLKELVELLTFNPSLRLAVEHDYIQLIGQEQTKEGITARIEHLIVDQKQVEIFYTLDSDRYTAMDATPELRDIHGDYVPAGISSGSFGAENGDLRRITVDFVEEDVPDALELTLKVHDNGSVIKEEPLISVDTDLPPETSEPLWITEFVFLLEFDPQFTEQGRTVTVNRTVELDGQKITVTDMEIYPSHIRINVVEDENNSAWLVSLRFYLELENGLRIETISNGITATGSVENPAMTSYRAESSYFYDAECIRLVITGADFLQKDRETIHIDLTNLTSDPLPQGVALWEAKHTTQGWILRFRVEETDLNHVQVLSSDYYDEAGIEWHINRFSSSILYDEETMEEIKGWIEESFYLDGYQQNEVWCKVNYTHFWTPDSPVEVELIVSE